MSLHILSTALNHTLVHESISRHLKMQILAELRMTESIMTPHVSTPAFCLNSVKERIAIKLLKLWD